MTNNAKAWMWGCLPGTVLILNLVLYAVINFVLSMMAGSGEGSMVLGIGRILHTLQAFIGIVTVIMIPVGIVMAIIMATKDAPGIQQPPVTK